MFDVRKVDLSATPNTKIPAGSYDLVIRRALWTKAKTGGLQLKLRLSADGKNTVVWVTVTSGEGEPNEVGRALVAKLVLAFDAVDEKGQPVPEKLAGGTFRGTLSESKKGNDLTAVTAKVADPDPNLVDAGNGNGNGSDPVASAFNEDI